MSALLGASLFPDEMADLVLEASAGTDSAEPDHGDLLGVALRPASILEIRAPSTVTFERTQTDLPFEELGGAA